MNVTGSAIAAWPKPMLCRIVEGCRIDMVLKPFESISGQGQALKEVVFSECVGVRQASVNRRDTEDHEEEMMWKRGG